MRSRWDVTPRQEGHTAHATAEEAEAEAVQMINVYREFAEDVAAMPVIVGRKSRVESFAGANCTYTIEAMMGDRRALQAGSRTFHFIPLHLIPLCWTQRNAVQSLFNAKAVQFHSPQRDAMDRR